MMMNSQFGRFIHDISTPLTIVKMNLDQFKQSKSKKVLERIESGIDELSYLVNMSSSQCGPRIIRSTVIKELNKILKFYSLKFNKDKIQIKTFFEEDFFLINSVDKFHRIIINLINNAADALRNVNRPKKIYIRTYREEAGFMLSVEDNGEGISAENLHKIFYERFTTKSEGNGLGLINIKKLLFESFNGVITCNSFEGRGTRFEIILPDAIH